MDKTSELVLRFLVPLASQLFAPPMFPRACGPSARLFGDPLGNVIISSELVISSSSKVKLQLSEKNQRF